MGGGSVVFFDKAKGANFTRTKKRMRGEINTGPEIKKWNCFSAGNTYTSYDFSNVVHAPTTVFGVFNPCRFQWPQFGTGSGNRVGNKINFLGFRLKGWITLAPTQLKPIRWRLVLVRLDLPNANINLDANGYLTQFANSSSVVPGTFDLSTYETYARHNFYKKFKDVNNDVFKTKVLASGTLPPTVDYKKLHLALLGTTGSNQTTLATRPDNVSYVVGVHSGNAGYLPIDVKVKLNDTIDCAGDMRRYYIVLEADCCYGWNDEGVPTGSDVGMMLNVYCRGYYTDE